MNGISRHSIVRVFCVCLVMAGSAIAQSANPATTLFDFITMRYDARSAALAGASLALPNDVYGLPVNPAVLGYIEDRQVAVGTRTLAGIVGAPLLFAQPSPGPGPGWGVLGVGVVGLFSGGIDHRDERNVASGLVARYNAIAPMISWARKVSAYGAAGISIKGLYESEGMPGESYSVDGMALDGGLQFRFLDNRLIYGVALRNYGFVRSGYAKGENYPLPTTVGLGFSFVPEDLRNIRIVLDLEKQRATYLTVRPGLEIELARNQMVGRIGYGFSSRDFEAFGNWLKGDTEENYYRTSLAALCLGAGFKTRMFDRRVNFDAAVVLADNTSITPAFVVSLLTRL